MQDDLATLIKKTAASVRLRDFIWAIGISAGVGAVLIFGEKSDWRIALLAWLAFLAALGVRYRFSRGRAWAQPVQRIVETELEAKSTELANLRVAHDVAQALPEPLFILDTEGVIEHANPAAEDLVELKNLAGRHIAAVLRAPDVFDAVEDVLESKTPRSVDFVTSRAVERSCRAFIAPLGGGGESAKTASRRVLIFVRDLTSERRLEQMRADFIASASHELRTPLASLMGFIETLKGPAQGDAEAQEKFLSIMQAQAKRMQRLVADLMSLSRIELNEHVPPRDLVDLAEIVAGVIESLAPLFENANAIIDFSRAEDEAIMIIGERDEIFQAIQNLLDNAVKYGGDPAMIKVNVGRGAAPALEANGASGQRAGDSAAQISARLGVAQDQLAFIQVRDFGAGIERSDLPRLTERFYRVDIEQSRKSGGTGLGLAIVKHIVNRHKGGFQIESRLAGGSAFTCYFRAVDRAQRAAQ